jgi:hypothetical protein
MFRVKQNVSEFGGNRGLEKLVAVGVIGKE